MSLGELWAAEKEAGKKPENSSLLSRLSFFVVVEDITRIANFHKRCILLPPHHHPLFLIN